MNDVTRKLFSGVSDQVRLKPAQLQSLARVDILDKGGIDIILSRQRTTKALIRLRGCANSIDPDQRRRTPRLIWVYTVCLCLFCPFLSRFVSWVK